MNREAWKRLLTELPEKEDIVVYRHNHKKSSESLCEEGGMRHPWLVGRVLSSVEEDGDEKRVSFRVQEMGRPVPQAKDTFKSKNKYFLRYQETKKAKKKKDADVTTDVYKTPKAQISAAAVRVVSTVSFDSLAWWGKKEKVLKKTGQLFHEVLKELSSNTRINWELPKPARTKAPGKPARTKDKARKDKSETHS